MGVLKQIEADTEPDQELWYADTADPRHGALEQDPVNAEQYLNECQTAWLVDGERRLMLAVLQEALDDLKKFRDSRDVTKRQHAQEIQEWIECTDDTELFSFENVCATLGISADYVRDSLKKWRRPPKGSGTAVAPYIFTRRPAGGTY